MGLGNWPADAQAQTGAAAMPVVGTVHPEKTGEYPLLELFRYTFSVIFDRKGQGICRAFGSDFDLLAGLGEFNPVGDQVCNDLSDAV